MTDLRQRQPRVEDKAFLAFVRARPCCVCGVFYPIQAAHIRNSSPEHNKRATGLGERPDDKWTVPLCVGCHLDAPDSQHRVGERAFWSRVGVDPFAVAQRLYAEFLASQGVKPMMEPGLECEFVIDDNNPGVARRTTPQQDPELYRPIPKPLARNRSKAKRVKRKIPSRRKMQSRGFRKLQNAEYLESRRK